MVNTAAGERQANSRRGSDICVVHTAAKEMAGLRQHMHGEYGDRRNGRPTASASTINISVMSACVAPRLQKARGRIPGRAGRLSASITAPFYPVGSGHCNQ